MPMCIGTCAMVFIPLIVEKILHCKTHPIVYLFGELYTIGPMFGVCYKLYYITTWWDKLMHISGGFLFALIGLYLIQYLNRNKVSALSCSLFALCFSIAISACWEFVEFGSDRLFGSDMQKDTVLTAVRTEYLGDAPGTVGSIDNIEEVVVNGEKLPVKGYIDIGLFDSMEDMFVESAGALIVAVFYLIDRGKHKLFIREQPEIYVGV